MSRVLPILFNTEMVRAILDGRKTATRRLVRFLPGENPNWTGYIKDGLMLYNGKNEPCCRKPQYAVGDIMYVRETWCNANKEGVEPNYYYYADTFICEDYDEAEWKWRPSIHMPKDAARIWLRVTDVRVERLQDITDIEAEEKEGAQPQNPFDYDVDKWPNKEHFKEIWDSTIEKRDIKQYGWDANPWVWVIEFERCEKPKEVMK